MECFDLIVIGSGGGLTIAGPAAERGLRVALIEEGRCGGTCLNRGCIPSKMLVYPAAITDMARAAGKLNVQVPDSTNMDFPALVRRTSRTVDAVSEQLAANYANMANLRLMHGHGAFVDNHTLDVDGHRITAPKIFIATGSRSDTPPISGLADTPFMTSREALRREDLPDSMLVLGAGYIAVELGYVYARAGCRVEFIVRSRFLRKEDPEIAAEFERVFDRHHTVHKGFHPTQVRFDNGTFTVSCRTPDGSRGDLTAAALLVATGVRPNTDRLGLEHTDIELDEQGYIRVDACLQTAVPGIYALGDVLGRHLFRHTVNHEAAYLMRTAFETAVVPPLTYGPVPHAVFGHPEIAGVGSTEPQLQAAGTNYCVGRATYADSTPGMARLSDHGLVKLLFDRRSTRLLGAHIVGDEASNMIHMLIAFMKKDGTLDDLLDTIFIHPALPEVVRDAARDAGRRL
jgi:mycothione reductase